MTQPRPWIKVVATRARKLADAREAVTRRESELAEGVRACLEHGWSAVEVAEAASISRARVYQIRDGRR